MSASREQLTTPRIGHGFDVHRFAAAVIDDKPLILGGVTLPEALSLEAHSDGDVVLHALCDALLGAIGEGDIGEHFPDTDANFAGASSVGLLEEVWALVAARGLVLANLDLTVVAQKPKLSPHRALMRERIAAVLAVDPSSVNIKATTTEQLGAIGRGEGIACHAVVLLLPCL
ncbi:MAG: 2-C-methyl-D-erythritol 2,4-cyclodiphosphate synthase [Gammaproteobacteria bacterium]|jgi:2-C-methyl-D-erythritol 2,4-cyclodiphosphate synthase|nr:2-C-methyl-D-erythritol 2,4-cyclodiphosphate synthase [Gammaproteobacteria bacterium]